MSSQRLLNAHRAGANQHDVAAEQGDRRDGGALLGLVEQDVAQQLLVAHHAWMRRVRLVREEGRDVSG